MPTYLVQQTDDVTRIVEGADAYAPEGVLTTFFATRDGRGVIDSWADRVASFRTAGIASVERIDPARARDDGQGTNAPVSASAQKATASAPPAAYNAGSSRSCPSTASAPAMARGNALVA